jgi:two-component system LytT family sensor kinase
VLRRFIPAIRRACSCIPCFNINFRAMIKLKFKPWYYDYVPLVVWLLLLVLPFINPPGNMPDAMRQHFITTIVISNTLLLLVFYVHSYLIYPLSQSKNWLMYCLALGGLLALYWLGWRGIRIALPPHPPFGMPQLQDAAKQSKQIFTPGQRPPFGPNGGPGNFFPFIQPLIAILCSFCYRIILDNNRRLHLEKEKETANLRTELNFLRSQINPHFLFNILNNLTSLARKRSEKLEPAIVNLSQLMRYMLNESDDDMVPLANEINYLKSYIDLQLLRFGQEVTVNLDIPENLDDCKIGSMLLISLVENAFKHGTDLVEPTTIYITLRKPENTGRINFSVVNDIRQSAYDAEHSTGIGLKNLKRRLDILYLDKYNLQIKIHESVFTAELMLTL